MLRNLTSQIGLHSYWRTFSVCYSHSQLYFMCIDKSTNEAGITLKIHGQKSVTLFPNLFILLMKYSSTCHLRWPKHLRNQYGAGRSDTGPWATSTFLKQHLAATQGIPQCPNRHQTAPFSELHPIFFAHSSCVSSHKGRQKYLGPKHAAYPSASDFCTHINSKMCSKGIWERRKGFAFIGRTWLALNLSKTPIVVNGE